MTQIWKYKTVTIQERHNLTIQYPNESLYIYTLKNTTLRLRIELSTPVQLYSLWIKRFNQWRLQHLLKTENQPADINLAQPGSERKINLMSIPRWSVGHPSKYHSRSTLVIGPELVPFKQDGRWKRRLQPFYWHQFVVHPVRAVPVCNKWIMAFMSVHLYNGFE